MLNYVHPADVLALNEGAEEEPAETTRTLTRQCMQKLLRDVGGMIKRLGAGPAERPRS